jgi:hypothetical protein
MSLDMTVTTMGAPLLESAAQAFADSTGEPPFIFQLSPADGRKALDEPRSRLRVAGLLGPRERPVQVARQQPQRVLCVTRLLPKTTGPVTRAGEDFLVVAPPSFG